MLTVILTIIALTESLYTDFIELREV